MNIVITDVSVFFDLFHLQVLNEFFAMELEIHTTNYVYNEIVNVEQIAEFEVFERNSKLKIIHINSFEEEEIRGMKLKRVNRSFPDLSVLWKALKLNCPLLTCDNKLRKEAEGLGIEVHGSIWVVRKLIETSLLSTEKGLSVLEQMKLINSRLPHDEIDSLREWLRNKKTEA